MSIRTTSKVFFLLFCLALLGNCGQLGMVLSTGGTYQIRTLVNDTFLDDYSLISTGASIRPYCDNSITKDPDISELLLFFKNSQGETVGRRIRYVLKLDADDYPQIEESPDVGKTDEDDSAEDSEDTIDGEGNSEDSEGTIGEEGSSEESEEEVKFDLHTEEPDSIEPIVIQVKRFDKNLPPFTMPVDMEIGAYTLIIRVLGGNEIIGETEQDFFYLGNADFSLKDIQLYLPGNSGSRLIPLGTTVLLEAKIEADGRLNPYIVWHNGKKIIQEGSLSDGANLIFWKAPEQTGFHTLRAEIFPSRLRQGVQGISREIVLPVSAKAAGAGFFPDQTLADFVITASDSSPEAKDAPQNEPVPEWNPDPIHWYQFAGTLHDSNNPLATGKTLVPVREGLPRWRPMDYSYGLVTGPSDIYSLPPVSFIYEEEQKGGGLFLLRIKAVSDGNIFNAVFESNGQVKMDISYNDGHLALSLGTTGNPAKEALIPLNKPDETGAHISAAVLFYLFEDRLEARLIVQEDEASQNVSLGIGARGLNGKCRISIGGMANSDGYSEYPLQTPSEEQTRKRNERQKRPETAIWNEFAVLYMVPPEEPVLAELDIEEIAEDEDVVEETAPEAAKAIPNAESETEAIIDGQEEETEPQKTETAAHIESKTEEPSDTVPENN
jgi:hypothetical protein